MTYILSRQHDRYPEIIFDTAVPQEAHWSFRLKGLPVPRQLVPTKIGVKSASPMPHCVEWSKNHFVVSSLAKSLLESLVPGLIEYLSIQINAPSEMQLDSAYYYINLLSRTQLVDWSNTTLDQKEWRRDQAGRAIIYAPLPPEPGHVAFREMPKYFIWHEEALETADAIYQYYPSNHLLSDELWGQLDGAFGGTIDARKIP